MINKKEENVKKYNNMIKKINAMSKEKIEKLIMEDKCPFDPRFMVGIPIGMFHCEVCGKMVLAGAPHPRKI